MQCITVTYSNPAEGCFDFDYYVNRHLPMVRDRLGENCSQVEVRRGQAALDGSPAVYRCIATLWIQPVIQIDEILG
ncbi:MAG: EthD family reductase [Hahellaceae bacterium]|nr:EthD family reductase [Hahellaceae bacterium]